MLIGRVWEYSDPNNDGSNKPTHLSLSDGGNWFQHAIDDGYYQTGTDPALGAVICFDRSGSSGHVAIVEEIGENNGRKYIVTSNSAWQSTYFYTQTLYEDEGYTWSSAYRFQGFIYCYTQPTPPIPPIITRKHKFPWALYARKLRARNIKRNML